MFGPIEDFMPTAWNTHLCIASCVLPVTGLLPPFGINSLGNITPWLFAPASYLYFHKVKKKKKKNAE